MQPGRTPGPDLCRGVPAGLGLTVGVSGNQTCQVLDTGGRRTDVQEGRGQDDRGRSHADHVVSGLRCGKCTGPTHLWLTDTLVTEECGEFLRLVLN